MFKRVKLHQPGDALAVKDAGGRTGHSWSHSRSALQVSELQFQISKKEVFMREILGENEAR